MAEKRLVPLDEHNAFVRASVHDALENEERPNGLACPKCAKELNDVNPSMLMTVMPPQKAVHCPHCGWRGQRLA